MTNKLKFCTLFLIVQSFCFASSHRVADEIQYVEVIEDDMIYYVRKANGSETRAGAINHKGSRLSLIWPEKTVAYKIDSSVGKDKPLFDGVMKAMNTIKSATKCIKFEKYNKNKHKHYTTIKKGTGCSSTVGYDTPMKNKQNVNLKSIQACPVGSIVHELLHTLGFFHEQTRNDRDDYVTIDFDNIGTNHKHNFEKDGKQGYDTSYYKIPYNFESIMHYQFTAFAENKKKPVMIPKCNRKAVGWNIDLTNYRNDEYLSLGDLQMIARRYKCSTEPTKSYEIPGMKKKRKPLLNCPRSSSRMDTNTKSFPKGSPNCLLPGSENIFPECKLSTTQSPQSSTHWTTTTLKSSSTTATVTTTKASIKTTTTKSPPTSDETEDYQKAARDEHNLYRKNHQSPDLILDSELNANAIKCAEYYASKMELDNSCPFKNGAGENSIDFTGDLEEPFVAELTTDIWYEEEEDYDYGNPGYSEETFHFTQLVWKSTTSMGFGIAYNDTDVSEDTYTVAVALYNPPGNVNNAYGENVLLYEVGYQDKAMNLHNEYRKKHQVGELSFGQNLNQIAMQCAQYYIYDQDVDQPCPYVNYDEIGENVMDFDGQWYSGDAAEAAVEIWYSEESDYDYEDPEYSEDTADFVQMVWKSSQYFGFAVANNSDYVAIVGLYSPPGNTEEGYKENVFPPSN